MDRKPPVSASPPGLQARATSKAAGIPGVKHVIAVASGKGGVGKSTTSCNLALGFAALGLKTGILDADIYGPSQPKLFGLRGKPRQIGPRMLEPMERFGVKVMSIGFLVEEDNAMIWRGPAYLAEWRTNLFLTLRSRSRHGRARPGHPRLPPAVPQRRGCPAQGRA